MFKLECREKYGSDLKYKKPEEYREVHTYPLIIHSNAKNAINV